MGTRATYRFLETEFSPETTVYINDDGYPSGAVKYYILPACKGNYRRLSVEKFIRANEKAEICNGHDSHGDTEYRYDFTQSFTNFKPHPVMWIHVRHLPPGSDEWVEEFNGTLDEFIGYTLPTVIASHTPEY